MSIQTQYSKLYVNGNWDAQSNREKAPIRNFRKELKEFVSCCTLNPNYLSEEECAAIEKLLSSPVSKDSPLTLKTFLSQLRDSLELVLRKPFHIYLRGSTARHLMNLEMQLDWVIKKYMPHLTKDWEEERKNLPTQSPPNDIDFLLYTDHALNEIELRYIAREIFTFTNKFLGYCKKNPKIMERNSLNETQESLVLAKITDSLDITVGKMHEIFNLFTLDAPILNTDPRQSYYFALSLDPRMFWRGVADNLLKSLRIESRHEKDFYAYLAGIQHVTKGYELIEESSSLKKIARHFLSKEEITTDILSHTIRERIRQHSVDGFSFLFNACMFMPQENAKREAVWQILKEEYPSGMPFEDAPLESVVCELFYLKQAMPNHPVFKNKNLIFPNFFELKTNLKLRSRIEREIFITLMRQKSKCNSMIEKNPYCDFLQLLNPLIAKNSSQRISRALITRIIDWIEEIPDPEYALVLNKFKLSEDTKREEFCLKLLSTSYVSDGIDYIKKKHPEWDPEKRFHFLLPHLKSEKQIENLFREIEKPTEELLLILSKHPLNKEMIFKGIADHLISSPQEARAQILERFPQKYWMQFAFNTQFLTPDQAKPLLQKLLDIRPTLKLFRKCQERGITLTWPQSVPFNLPLATPNEMVPKLTLLSEQKEIDEDQKLSTDDTQIEKAPPKISLDRRIDFLISNQWEQHLPEALSTLSNLIAEVLLLTEESQFNHLKQLATLQREDLHLKVMDQLRAFLKDGSEKGITFYLRRLPANLRENLLLNETILPLESTLQILQEVYNEQPHLALYWFLEEHGIKFAKPKKSNLDKNRKPNSEAIQKRLHFLLKENRLFEYLETAIEFHIEDHAFNNCLIKAMQLPSIQQLPRLLTKQKALELFLNLVNEKWVNEILQMSLTQVQAHAILKIFSINEFKNKFNHQLSSYYEALFQNPISIELDADLLKEIIVTKEAEPLLPAILTRLHQKYSPSTTEILECNKMFFLRLCSSSDPVLYKLISLFDLQGIRWKANLPHTFSTFLAKKVKDPNLDPHEKLLIIKMAFMQIEWGNLNRDELTFPLFEEIYHLNNTDLFKRWMKIQPKDLNAILPLLTSRFEWMMELLLQDHPELMAHCLLHPELDLKTFRKLLPLIEKYEFQDLCIPLERFPSEKENIIRILVQLHKKKILDAANTEWLVLLALELIAENNPELIMRSPSLFDGRKNLGEKAMLISLPKLIDSGELDTVDLWLEHFSCEDSAIYIMLLSKILENTAKYPVEKFCKHIQRLTINLPKNTLSNEQQEVLVRNILLCKTALYSDAIHENLCLLAERTLSACNLTASQEMITYTFLASSARNVNLKRCKELLQELQSLNLDFIYALLTVSAKEGHEELQECMESLKRSPLLESGQMSDAEMQMIYTFVQIPHATTAEDKETVIKALEQIIEIKRNPLKYKLPLGSLFSTEKTLEMGLQFLLSIKEYDLFEKYLYLCFISKIYPSHFFYANQQTKVELLFSLVSILKNYTTEPKKFHSIINNELRSIISQLIPKVSLECLPYLASAFSAFLTSLLQLPHVTEEDYAQSIECLFEKVYSYPSSTESEMAQLDLLLQKIFERKFYLKKPSTLIRYELWSKGTSKRSEAIIKSRFPESLFQAFKELNCNQLSHRPRLMSSLLYGLNFCGSNPKRALLWHKQYIEALRKMENHSKEEMRDHMIKVFEAYPLAGSTATMNEVLKFIQKSL